MAQFGGRGSKKHSRRKVGLLAQRTGGEWLARGSAALVLAILGYLSTTSSLAQVVVRGDPSRAHALAPGDGVIMAQYAEQAFSLTPTDRKDSLPSSLSRRALIADPTATDALTVLGFQAQLSSNPDETDRIFSYSTRLSRRELRPRIWAIEQAVMKGDIAGALRNYDIALRTSKDAPGMLFPTLSAALSGPRIRAALLPILGSGPVWKEDFIAYAASSGIEPEGTIALLQDGSKYGLEPTESQRADLVNALVSRNKPQHAWAYYASFRPAVEQDRSRDPEFALEAPVRTVFDWRAGSDTRLSAAILRQGKSGLLDFAVPPSVGGELVQQTQLLPAGTYRFTGRSVGIEQPEGSRPYWTLSCQDGQRVGNVTVPNSSQNDGKFSGVFVVPQGCKTQTLSLVARSTDDILGVSGQIEYAEIVRVK